MTEPGKAVRLSARLVPMALIVGSVCILSMVFDNAGPASADDPNGKDTICHATGSSTNPFVEITIDKHAEPAHLGGPNLNGNGNVDHKGHGDILLNPGSINPGSIGHGPISAAECEQLSTGTVTPISTPEAGEATQEATGVTEDATEVAPEAPTAPSTSGLEKARHSEDPRVVTSPVAAASPTSAATPSPELEHRTAGGGAQSQMVTASGDHAFPTSVPQNSGSAGSNGRTQQGVGAGLNDNTQAGKNVTKPASGDLHRPVSGSAGHPSGGQPASSGPHH